jgi:hypothetical protein
MVLGQFSDICGPSANIIKLAKGHKGYGSAAIYSTAEKEQDSTSRSFLDMRQQI